MSKSNKGTIILDRDGVINVNRAGYVKSLSEFKLIEGSIDAIKTFAAEGYFLAVASNQAGVAKGMVSKHLLQEIEELITDKTGCNIRFYYCTHLPKENCLCRKPNPGLLEQIKQEYRGPFFFIGDNITDYYAAMNANIGFNLVLTGHGSKYRRLLDGRCGIYRDLQDFSRHYLKSMLNDN
jgi:D-glycero-D-manno-heptose 1,7-bisphosphate phosphatase